MSWKPAAEPDCGGHAHPHIETVIEPQDRDLGGFSVRRALPSSRRRMVGPFIFFDEVGPATLAAGEGIDVRPHPHIGLATVTYLFEGEFQHRDSLGTDCMVYPGELNWMVAGRGITHSERTSAVTRASAHPLHGIQTWVALPEDAEDAEPSFQHFDQDALPQLSEDGVQLRLILGEGWGLKAPARVFSPTFYADVRLSAGAELTLPQVTDRAVYVVEGAVQVDGQRFERGRMLVFAADCAASVRACSEGARLMALGGEPLGRRYIEWNFVASDRARIAAAREAWAQADWQNGPFRLPPGDDGEHIPLPG